ncbi:hypothetical protein JCM3770_001820 [Rhodotorula araucariae]
MSAESTSAPWALHTPVSSSLGPEATAPAPPLTPPHFSSSWGAFNLPQPRAAPSNLTIALQSREFGSTAIGQPPACQGLAPPVGLAPGGLGGASFGRRMSALGTDTPMTMQWDDDGNARGSSGAATPGNGDEAMSMSPGMETDLPPPQSTTMFRQTRSRSGSASAPMLFNPAASLQPQLFPFTSIPPSPVTVARALQHGQKTPPPFLQRRLFKDDPGSGSAPEEVVSGSGRSSRSGSSSDIGIPGVAGKTRAMRIAAMTTTAADDDEEIEELSMVLSRSASAGPEDAFERVVRRPVSRKPNLLPKPKSHLRILSELRSESSGDQEIVSEATLHRLSRAGASAVPSLRSSCPPSFDARPSATSASAPAASTSSFPARSSQHPRPTPNRFPEQAAEDEDLLSHRTGGGSSSSSNDDGDDVLEGGSDWGAMSVGGYATEEDEERRSNVVWNGIRSGPGGNAVTVATLSGTGRSPHGDRRGMELETPFAAPQTPSATLATRPGKRKMNDDRFEPYAHQAFKRRAVSPAASLSLSPGFANPPTHHSSSSSTSSRPTPPPLPMSSLGQSSTADTQPVAIPSPSNSGGAHYHFFSSVSGAGVGGGGGSGAAGMRSRAGSPAAASSLSSSTGRGFAAFAVSERHRPAGATEERERALAMKLDPDGLGRMSLAAGEEEEV